jgi:hypothetical protein
MIDLPDYGYTEPLDRAPIDPAGVVDGALGGPSDIIDRPGYRYAVQFTLAGAAKRQRGSDIPNAARARRARRCVVSVAARHEGPPPASLLLTVHRPTGSVIPIKGLAPNYQIKQGQPLAVISEGIRFIHKAAAATRQREAAM